VTYTDDEVNYRWNYYGQRYSESSSYRGSYYGRYTSDPDDILPPAQRRFIEALADALIGETRHYFVADGNVISISLSGNQIPELAQYAIAAAAELTEEYTYGEELDDGEFMLGADARFTNGLLEVTLDDDNNVTGALFSIEVASTVRGELQTIKAQIDYKSMFIGETVVIKPDGNAFGKPILPTYDEAAAAGAAIVKYEFDSAVA
jgi:hypothetical protein